MRAVIQRVARASVAIGGREHSSIGAGLLVLLGIEQGDTIEDVQWLARKIPEMRIFSDADGKMNVSVAGMGGEILLVSQFTLHASTKKGNRPSFIKSARPEAAVPLYEHLRELLESSLDSQRVKTGVFGGDMQVALINDGPVTIIMDSKDKE